jgi:hypothetical protein
MIVVNTQHLSVFAANALLLSLHYTAARNTNVMTNSYRKTVNTVGGTDIQRFNCFASVKEKFGQQFPYPMHPSIEPAFTQHFGNHSGGADKTDACFNIAAKISRGKQYNRNDFCISCFSVYGLFIAHRFQNIVKKCVHCNSFYNHGQSVFKCVEYTSINGLAFF